MQISTGMHKVCRERLNGQVSAQLDDLFGGRGGGGGRGTAAN
jgi:hypothetical protein